MLSMALTAMSLMIIPKMSKMYWHIAMISLSLITLKLIMMEYSTSLLMTSKMMMMDSMSLTLTALSAWITMLMMLASYKIMDNKNKPIMFMATSIILLTALIMSFNSASILSFYIAFEASLIPTMTLIMLWGYQPERSQASMYLILYTVTASMPLLAMILYISKESKTLNFSMPEMFTYTFNNISDAMQPLMWFMIMTAFMVKLPMFMVHLWLPKAHVEAPVAGSMILAAILLKLGGYGAMRMIMTFMKMNKTMNIPMMSIALTGGVVTSMICLRQSDMKSLIAYSSIGHMALMLAGTLSGTKLGMQASLSMMLAHGLSSSAMFCLANSTYSMTMTRSITLTKGLLSLMPTVSLWWFLGCCANMAAPPTINLMSEIFLITATMSQSMILMIPLAIISFITAAYSLYLYSTVNHGQSMTLYNPMSSMTMSDTVLINLHLIPVVLLMLKPEMIISWC